MKTPVTAGRYRKRAAEIAPDMGLARTLVAERDHHGASERRDVDDRVRLELRGRVVQRIGERETTLGVGVVDLRRSKKSVAEDFGAVMEVDCDERTEMNAPRL